jgi:CubicO group peptidase (beta-lactamase class C family)|tara:strand:+ start:2291 stop:3430 length:1140 start_codon:yes stop_codon:yes gene_type:complete
MMNRTIALAVALCGSLVTSAANAEGSPNQLAQGPKAEAYWPTAGWRTAKPEAVGMNSAKLLQAVDYAGEAQYKTDGVAIIKDGYIVAEAYFGDFKQDSQHFSASVAKSFTNALVGIAIDKGLVPGVHAKLCQYFDEWDCSNADDMRSKIEIRHALTLTTGLKWQENWSKIDPATNDALKMGASRKFLEYMLNREALHVPGTKFTYSTGDPMFMSGVLAKATGMSAFEFAKKHLFDPMGVSSVRWTGDSQGYTGTYANLNLTVRDYAKLGYLYLNKGRWDGKQIVSEDWVAKSIRPDPTVSGRKTYGYLWHINLSSRPAAKGLNIPGDAYMAAGVMGQNIVILPSNDIVIVRVATIQGGGVNLMKFISMVLDAADEGATS